ncbi:MAG: hypothetical protein ABIQ18_01970 [Umezawaea sp.]
MNQPDAPTEHGLLPGLLVEVERLRVEALGERQHLVPVDGDLAERDDPSRGQVFEGDGAHAEM